MAASQNKSTSNITHFFFFKKSYAFHLLKTYALDQTLHFTTATARPPCAIQALSDTKMSSPKVPDVQIIEKKPRLVSEGPKVWSSLWDLKSNRIVLVQANMEFISYHSRLL